METVDYDYIARMIAHLSGIPTRVFRGESLLCYHAVVSLPKDPMLLYRDEIFTIRDRIGYYATPSFHIYGVIKIGEIRFVVGPAAQILAEDQSYRRKRYLFHTHKPFRNSNGISEC